MNTSSDGTYDRSPSLQQNHRKKTSVNYLSSWALIRPFLMQQKRTLLMAVGLATLAVVFELFPIYAIYRLIVLAFHDALSSRTVSILTISGLICIVLSYLLMGLAYRTSHLLAFNTLYQLRMKIAKHLALLPMGFFSRKKSGDGKKILIDDPEQLELIIAHAIPEGLSAVVTWVAVSCWLFYIDWRMAIAAILITPISFYLLLKGMRKGALLAPLYQQAGQRMNASVVEYLNGLPIIKIFNQQGRSYQETEKAIKYYATVEKQWARAYLPYGGTFFSLILSNVVFIVVFGSLLLVHQELDVTTFIFFVIVGANYSRPLLKLFNLFHQFAHISMNSQLTQSILATSEQKDTGNRVQFDDYTIQFNDVSFQYEQKHVLNHVSLTARQNEITALVGPSGAGKSTIAVLIARFFDISQGSIRIGGHSIAEISLAQLMETVSFVFQDNFLFTGTIAENIKFARPDASDEAMIAAAKAAQIHTLIDSLPDGYQTRVGDKGRKLSGGELQRITIARAILKDAPIIILDEATAFTDPENEALIQRAIEALTRGKTVIMIAHRLNTIRNVDQIVVIHDGCVAESGRHEALIAHRHLYYQLWTDFCALQTDQPVIPERGDKNEQC